MDKSNGDILPPKKNVNLMDLFPKILNVDKETFKMTPSEYIREMSLSTEERHKKLVWNAFKLVNNEYPPQFRVIPHILIFQRVEPFTTSRLILEVKNVGKYPVPVKMHCPNSIYFSADLACTPTSKLVPGLSIEYEINFTPKEDKDYFHYLEFTSKEESFQVPIVAIGPRPMLDIPDQIVLNPSPVKVVTSKFIVVRNIGNAPAVFNFVTEGNHFQVSPSKGVLGVHDSMLLNISFESSKVKEVTETLYLTLETGEKFLVNLHGSAENVSVRLEKNSVVHENTFIGLKRCKTVRLINNSSHVIKFSWKKNKTQGEDLEFLESMKDKFIELSELEILKDAKVIFYGLGNKEKHKLSCERILKDELRLLEKEEFKFSDDVFSILPENGEVWPKGSLDIMISFKPKTVGPVSAEAYLEVSGRDSRLPLRMKGNGLGPKIVLNVKTLDIDYVYLCSLHRYEVTVQNKGDIPGTIQYKMEPLIFGGKAEVVPDYRYLKVGELGAFVISFKSNRPGEFTEKLCFTIKESGEIVSLIFKGRVVSPTLHFDIKQLDFGIVPFGVPVKREVTLNNLSVVPVTFSLRILPDGNFPSISCEEYARFIVKPAVPQNPREFEVDPEESVVEPFSSKKVTVILTANKVGRQQKHLVVDLWDSENDSASCPIKYKVQVASIVARPELLVIPFCFINYPYTKTVTLNNNSNVTGFFYVVPPDLHSTTSMAFSASIPQGLLEPGKTIKLDITIITSVLGKQTLTINMITFGVDDPQEMCTISCVGQGPVLSVKPLNLNWGDLTLLQTSERVLEFSNESPIPAVLTLNASSKPHLVCTVNPSNFKVMPQQSVTVTVGLMLKDRGHFKDNLKVNIYNGKDLTVPLQATGVGSSLLITPSISPTYNLGTLFCQKKYAFEITIENKGNRAYGLVWSPFADYKAFAAAKFTMPADNVFKVTPYKMDVLPAESKTMVFEIFSAQTGDFSQTFYCFAAFGSPNKELHLISEVSAQFVGPMITWDKEEMFFWNNISPERIDVKLNDTLSLKNTSVLPLGIEVSTTPPFCFEVEPENYIYNLELNLEGLENKVINVKFAGPSNPKKISKTYKGKLTITFKEHPKKSQISLTGEVNYPSVSIRPKHIDFGYIQVGTSSCAEVSLVNESPLTVYYNIKWSAEESRVVHYDGVIRVQSQEPEFNDQLNLPKFQSEVRKSVAEESQKLEDGSLLNETLPDASSSLAPPLKPIPRMPEIMVSDSDIKAALFPMTRSYYICDDDLMDAYKLVQSSDAENTDVKQDFTQFCDITPFYGKLNPYCSQILTVVIHTSTPMKLHVEAVMSIESGSEEVITIDAVASCIDFCLSTTELDFGKQLFCETKSQVLKIQNVAAMPFDYVAEIESECECQMEGTFPLGKGVMTVSPSSGRVNSFESAELIVRYHPGVPGKFENNFQLQIAHLDPIVVRVKGFGVFPQVYVTLPRPDILDITPEIGYSAVASITPDWIFSEFPCNYSLSRLDPLKPYRSRESLNDGSLEDETNDEKWELVRYSEFMPSEIDIYLAVERILAYNLISNDSNNAIFAVYARTIPRFNVPAYNLDFGICVIGRVVEQHVTIMNFGPLPVVIYGIFDSRLKDDGIQVRLKSRNEVKIDGCLPFLVCFHPKKSRFKKKYQKIKCTFYFEIYHGPKIPMNVVAEVTYPHVIPSMQIINFYEVVCGCCKIINLRLKNPGLVPARWYMTTKKTLGEANSTHTSDMKGGQTFHVSQSSGVLNPQEYCTVQVYFKPTREDSFSAVLYIHVESSLENLKVLLMGSGVEPRLCISKNTLDFKSTLPFPNKAEKVFSISNPCPFPVEFYFPEFDEQIFEEERILRAISLYYQSDEIFLPVRQPGEGLPAEIVEFYNMLLDGLNAKFIEEEREKILAERESLEELEEDTFSMSNNQLALPEKKKKFKKLSRSHTSMETSREFLGGNPSGREPLVASIFEQKTTDEIETMLEDYIKSLWGAEVMPDPIQASMKNILPVVKEEEYRNGTLIICHGAPFSSSVQLANRMGILINMPAFNIDYIVLTEAAFGRCEAGLMAKDLIEQAYCEYFGPETKKSTPLCEWEENEFYTSEENFSFDDAFQDIQRKFDALVRLRDNATSGKRKNGMSDTAKSDASKRMDKDASPGKPQTNINAPVANITQDIVVEILRYRLALEVEDGVIIESLKSVFISSPANTLISLLKAAGNIKDIIVVCFLNNYEQYTQNQWNIQAEQEAANQCAREEIQTILEEQPEEIFQSLNLPEEEETAARASFIASRQESQAAFEKKRDAFYEVERLKRQALKNGIRMTMLPLGVTFPSYDNVSQSERKDKETVRKKDGGKSLKTSDSKISRKTGSDIKSVTMKRDSLESEFLTFEVELIEMRSVIDNWDQRLGALVIDSGTEVKTKKGQTPSKESSSISRSKPSRGVFLWFVDVARPCNAFPACCSYLKEALREKFVPSESDEWPLTSGETVTLSVVPKPPRRIKNPCQHVFTISATDNVPMTGEDLYEDLDEYPAATSATNNKLNRSVSSVSLNSKRKESRASKRRKTDSRMSTEVKGHRFKKVISSTVFEENQLKPRWILLPREMQSFRVKYYPPKTGPWKQRYEINLVTWRNEDVVLCKGICDIPRINMTPKVLFPAVEHTKPVMSVFVPAYYYSEDAYDFGSVIIFQTSNGKRSCEKSADFNLSNISTIPVDLCVIFAEDGSMDELSASENFRVQPDKLWLKPGESKPITVTVSPARNGVIQETLLLLIRDNPKVEKIQITCEGVKPNVSVTPRIVNFERLLLYRKDFRQLVLANDNMIPLYFTLKDLEHLPKQLTFSHNSGMIPPMGSFNIIIHYNATEVQVINDKSVQVQVFDSLDSHESVQDLNFTVSAEAYDAALDIIFSNPGEDHLDFGDIRVENQYTMELNLKNVGKYPLGYKFDMDASFLSDCGNEQICLTPQDGKLFPGKLFPVTITFTAHSEVVWKRETLFKITLVEPFSADELIASIPIEISARSHFSRYEITPSDQLNFGHIRIGSETTSSLLIENKGHFSLSYYIEAQSTPHSEENVETKKSSKLSTASKEKADKGKKTSSGVFKSGFFDISPNAGTVETGQTAAINVTCCPNEVRKYEEKIILFVKESQPHLKKGNPITISAQACLPQIKFDDLRSVFREHLLCKDEAELDSRPKLKSYTVYSEKNNLFSFKNICVNKTAEARIHLPNAGMIDCRVTAFLGPPEDEYGLRTSMSSGEGVEYFRVTPERLIIEPYNSGNLLLTFQPNALEEYRATLTITLEMPDSYKNEVQVFHLYGNGILPQIEVTEPNTKLPDGQVLVNFPPTSPGHTTTSSIAFSNTGVLDCKVIVELYKQNHLGIFSLRPKPGTEKMLKIWELTKPIDHTVIVSLSPGEVAQFTVFFSPEEIQSYSSLIKLFIVDNPFENWCYKLIGEVFYEEVAIENIRTTMPFLGVEETDKCSVPVAPGQYFINFGECYIKKKFKILLRLSNKTEKDCFKFEWDEVQSISISPAVGHLYPSTYKEILLEFYTEEPMELEDVTISCLLNKILLANPPESSWDSRLTQPLKQAKGDTSARSIDKTSVYQPPDTVNETCEEPEHELIPESNKQLYINLSGIADYTRLTCETKKITFKNTFMFQTRMFPLVLENSGNVALEYKLSLKAVTVLPLKENKNSQVDEQLLKVYRPKSRPRTSGSSSSYGENGSLPVVSSRSGKRPRPFTSVSILDLDRSLTASAEQSPMAIVEEPKITHFNPFTIENATGRIPSKEKATCNIVFSPMDINEYRTAISIQVENLHPECILSEVEVMASSIMPYCHFDVPESDYLESGRRECSRPGPVGYSPGVPLHPDTKTIEVKVLGIGITTQIKFHGINPTEDDYTFSWVNTTQVQQEVVPSFHCSTMDGWIRAGRQQLMVFSFVSQEIGITESFWKFSIPKYGVETPFLFVGDVREPSVYFLSTHVNLMPTLIGSTSSDLITLANHEENPLEFYFVPESLYSEGRLNFLRVEPHSGKVPGNSETNIRVTFTGKTPGTTLFTVKCKVRSLKEPFIISVEATTYVVQPLVVFDDLKKIKHYVELNKENVIDFGSELIPNIPETVTLTLTSLSKTLFYYEWDYDEKVLYSRHCSLRLSVKNGHVGSFSRGKCDITILFKRKSSLLNFPLKLKIRRGPTFNFLIKGSASVPLCEFSFTSYDFGYCFLQEKDICFNETSLVLKNKDSGDLFLECALEESTAFSYSLPQAVVHPLEEIVIALCFHPKECVPYEDVLKFTINGCHERKIHLTGHGTDFKVALADAEDTTISLGAVKIGKTSTRKFSLVNRSLATATLIVGFLDQLPVKGWHLSQSKKSQVDLSQKHRLTGEITITPSTVFKIKPQETFTLVVTYTPSKRSPPFSETVYLQCQEKAEPLCILTGCCLGPEISLDRNFLNFGAVVENCTSYLRLKLVNSGSVGVRFEWNIEDLSVFTISPAWGYCSPESDVTIEVTFRPSFVQKCLRKSVECKLHLSENEPYPSLWLQLVGDCVSLPEPKDTLNFRCVVREFDSKEVEIENPSGNEWQLVPIISGEYFKGYEALIVPAWSSATYEVNFCPLTMTEGNDFHAGSLLFKLPNGQGLLFQLKGVALPPDPEDCIEREVPCKTKYVELLRVKNWLQHPQRFKVNIVQLENQDDPACSCTGFEYMEIPALAQKEYSLNFFAYNIGYLRFNVYFVNEETKEYVWYDVGFKVHMCGPLEVITLKSGIRQTCHHELKLENPLKVKVQYKLETTSPEINLGSIFYEVPPQQSVYFTISFTPIHPGEKTEMLNASCEELGVFPRELRLVALDVLPDPPRMFEAPLGTAVMQEFQIKNFSSVNAILHCKIDSEDFNFTDPGIAGPGQSTSIKVLFEPSEIGTTTGTLLVESEQAGKFVFPLLGICVKPLAKGPFILKPGTGINIPFKNVFKQAKEFHMFVDNPAFVLKTAQDTIPSKEETKIFVGFQKAKHLEKLNEYKEMDIEPRFPMMGQLVVECFNPYVKWQFYLKGVLEK